MSYRVSKKTNKKNELICLKCEFCKVLRESRTSCICECIAKNKIILGEFDARYLTCIEVKGFGEIPEREIEEMAQQKREKDSIKLFKVYAKKYYSKKEAEEMIKKRVGNI